MNLREWISELNAATTERDIVSVMDAFVKQMRIGSAIPEECMPRSAGNASEIRRAAKCLAEMRIDAATGADARETHQDLLVLFSLAVDRINMLEARGLLIPLGPMPRYHPRPAF
jgi:hypothetical protein